MQTSSEYDILNIKAKKNINREFKYLDLQKKISKLDKNKIHILFFEYNYSLKNFRKYPFMFLTTKLADVMNNQMSIDHVCHISNFYTNFDGARIFEANVFDGMVEHDLIDRVINYDGKIYIKTLGNVNKDKASVFENTYRGIPYDKSSGFYAGLVDFLPQKWHRKVNRDGAFCSLLVRRFLIHQGYDIKCTDDCMPSDLWVDPILAHSTLFFNSSLYE